MSDPDVIKHGKIHGKCNYEVKTSIGLETICSRQLLTTVYGGLLEITFKLINNKSVGYL